MQQPTYTVRVGRDYGPDLIVTGVTKPELRQRVDSWMKDERKTTLKIDVECVEHGTTTFELEAVGRG